MPVDPARAALASERASRGIALLVIDMISAWDFPDADLLGPRAVRIAPKISALRRRCKVAGIPTVFVNDNQGRWRSDFREMATLSASASETGATIAESLQPDRDDYAVLKPKHSAFFATPLDLLLRHLHVRRIVMTGVSADLCISMSAAEARMRDYEVVVPRDCVTAITTERTSRALRWLELVHLLKTTPSPRVRLTG